MTNDKSTMNQMRTQVEYSTSERTGNGNDSGAPCPYIKNTEIRRRLPPPPGLKRIFVSDITPGTSTSTGNRLYGIIDASQPGSYAIGVGIPCRRTAHTSCSFSVYGTVPAAVDAQLRRATRSLLNKLAPSPEANF